MKRRPAFCAISAPFIRTPHPRQGHIYLTGLTPLYEKLVPHLYDGVADPKKCVRLVGSAQDVVIPE